MRHDNVLVFEINIPERLRAVNNDKVRALAKSMDEIGLKTPITLHSAGPMADGFDLVAGAHRIAAAELLGWEWIEAFFTDGDEIDRQLWEIDENLMRSELTQVEYAEHLAKRKELWEERQSVQAAPIESKREDGKGHRPKEFAQETSEATGTNKSTINRAVSRAENTTKEARDLIKGTHLDTGTYLDKLKSVPKEDQAEKVDEDLKPNKPTLSVVENEQNDNYDRERLEKAINELRSWQQKYRSAITDIAPEINSLIQSLEKELAA